MMIDRVWGIVGASRVSPKSLSSDSQCPLSGKSTHQGPS